MKCEGCKLSRGVQTGKLDVLRETDLKSGFGNYISILPMLDLNVIISLQENFVYQVK